MAVNRIITLAEAKVALGKASSITKSEEGLINTLIRLVERHVKQYVGHNIIQTTYTEYYPSANPLNIRDAAFGNVSHIGPTLQLTNTPVQSITSVYERRGARAGTTSPGFDSDALLTNGDDYYLDVDEDGLSFNGLLIRVGNNWPGDPRSVQVTYSGGWSADQINGNVTNPKLDASDIKMATMITLQDMFNDFKNAQSGQSGNSGPIQREKLGDYEVEYGSDGSAGFRVIIPTQAKELLNPYRRVHHWVG